ncbi:MAG TPA: nucleoside hydrolase [Bryobacteraceae bacterium]|nr:nucleoside hydrolase [Bryobacteraceae bacterium]
MPRTFLIDTDTASDDAVALIMALRAPDVRVAAITVVAGNVPVAQATRNALLVTELCGSEVPVYSGAEGPLWREYANAEWFHGKDGLGDCGFAPPKRTPAPMHAVDAIIQTVSANPGLEMVTLGPLTNVALAIARDPSIVAKISRCVIMGGNPCCEGNVTPAAEYNIWVDPEAARMVFRSGLNIEMVGWHLCRGEAVLNAADIEHVLSLETPLARFAIDCNFAASEAYRVQTGEIGISLPDPVAMSIALDPTICTAASSHYTEIEVTSELTRGMTVVDRLNGAGNDRNREMWKPLLGRVPLTRICWTIDVARWKKALYSALQRRS